MQRGMTQQTLASISGLSLRTVKSMESNDGGPASSRSISKLATALKVPFVDLVDDLGSAAFESTLSRVGMAQLFCDSEIPSAVATAEAVPEEMLSDFDGAPMRSEATLRLQPGSELDLKAHVTVRTAIALDEAGQSQTAIDLLVPLVTGSEWCQVKPLILRWAKYHLGLAYRRRAEQGVGEQDSLLSQAAKIFDEFQDSGDIQMRTAALHQRGCVSLARAKSSEGERASKAAWRDARRCFERAVEQWRRAGSFREGYSLRRLSEMAEKDGDLLAAHDLLVDSIAVFARHDCERYVADVRSRLTVLMQVITNSNV